MPDLSPIKDGRTRKAASRIVGEMAIGGKLIAHHTGERFVFLMEVSGRVRELSDKALAPLLWGHVIVGNDDCLFPGAMPQTFRLAEQADA